MLPTVTRLRKDLPKSDVPDFTGRKTLQSQWRSCLVKGAAASPPPPPPQATAPPTSPPPPSPRAGEGRRDCQAPAAGGGGGQRSCAVNGAVRPPPAPLPPSRRRLQSPTAPPPPPHWPPGGSGRWWAGGRKHVLAGTEPAKILVDLPESDPGGGMLTSESLSVLVLIAYNTVCDDSLFRHGMSLANLCAGCA